MSHIELYDKKWLISLDKSFFPFSTVINYFGLFFELRKSCFDRISCERTVF